MYVCAGATTGGGDGKWGWGGGGGIRERGGGGRGKKEQEKRGKGRRGRSDRGTGKRGGLLDVLWNAIFHPALQPIVLQVVDRLEEDDCDGALHKAVGRNKA